MDADAPDGTQPMDDLHRLAVCVKRIALSQKTLLAHVAHLNEAHRQLAQDHDQLQKDYTRLLRTLVQKEKRQEAPTEQDTQ